MAVDGRGLRVRGRINLGTSAGKDAFEHVKAQDVTGLSVGYRVPPGGRVRNQDGSRLLVDVDLVEVSLTALPADDDARITEVKQVRLASKTELVEFLHKGGLARAAASKVASGGWPLLSKTDEEDDGCCDFCERPAVEIKQRFVGHQGRGLVKICSKCAREAVRHADENPDNLNSMAAALRASAVRWRK
jgi:hypothetical protein